MSNTLMCLTEAVPFHAQDVNKTELIYTDPPIIDDKSFKSGITENMKIFTLVQDENQYVKQDYSIKESSIQRQTVSRKREANNVLMECVKRRDIFRHFETLNVPLQQSSMDKPLQISEYTDVTSNFESNNVLQNSSLPDMSNISDSTSTDSGIDSLSKSSSPCHSIDTQSSQGDREGCGSPTMDIGSFDRLPALSLKVQNLIDCQHSHQSPVAIYEDLNCLHLTDEAVQLQSDALVKSPISKSLFKNVSSTIYFALKEERVSAMPDDVLPFMKWKLSTITPLLIKEIILKSGFSLLDANTSEEWLGTWGKHLKCASFKKIKNYQKVNHYPGSFHLGRKDKLWDNYKHMQSRFGRDVFNFFPETFYLPTDLNLLKNAWESEQEKCWIIKPPASARGTGVKVIHKWSQIPKNRPIIVQRYLSNPYLINGTKFDLRIYVLVPSIEPLRLYVFEDGLVRFASEKYSLSNKSFSNRFIHLTNYSINRKSSSYTANDDENSCQGHKWTLKTFWAYMSNSGIDVVKIQEAITDMIIKTVICAEGPICRLMKTYAKSTYSCYELFGFDIMLDKNLRPWLLEVNISPSLHTRSMLDSSVKGPMVKDMLNMVGFQVPEKVPAFCDTNPTDYGILSAVTNKHRSLRNRCLSNAEKEKHSVYTFQHEKLDILNELTPDDVRCLIESEDEFQRRGGFIRIFPSATTSRYFVYFEHIRYYNILLDAWEQNYCTRRNKGIQFLQELCEKEVHLQVHIHDSPRPVYESECEISGSKINSEAEVVNL